MKFATTKKSQSNIMKLLFLLFVIVFTCENCTQISNKDISQDNNRYTKYKSPKALKRVLTRARITL